jgi:hypothetical protein
VNRRAWIRPRFYRYRVADQVAARFRPGWNAYDNTDGSRCRIGAVVVIGHYAYCVRWAKAVLATPRPEGQR